MLGELAHVGYLAADLRASAAALGERFSLPVARELELPQFSLSAIFLGAGSGTLEVFTFNEPALLRERLGGGELTFDHAAYTVAELQPYMDELASRGVRFSGPDRAEFVTRPFDLGGSLHAWTVPGAPGELALQLIQPPR